MVARATYHVDACIRMGKEFAWAQKNQLSQNLQLSLAARWDIKRGAGREESQRTRAHCKACLGKPNHELLARSSPDQVGRSPATTREL